MKNNIFQFKNVSFIIVTLFFTNTIFTSSFSVAQENNTNKSTSNTNKTSSEKTSTENKDKLQTAQTVQASEKSSSTEKSNSILNDDLVDDEETTTPLNKDARLEGDDQVSKVFRNMVVVQRKAKNKAKSFLFTTIMGFDFSDGPATFYTLNTNLGYAVNDFWEIYINYVPQFYVIERGIVKKVAALELADPTKSAAIEYVKPKQQVGLELLWAPAYGKDSWGPYSIIRSDTFFKIGASQTTFEDGRKGLRYALMGGKTFFVAKYFNTRVAGGFHHMQTYVDRESTFNTLLFLEGGLVFYF